MANPRKRKAAIIQALQAMEEVQSTTRPEAEERVSAVIDNIVAATDEEISQEDWLEKRAAELASALETDPVAPVVKPKKTTSTKKNPLASAKKKLTKKSKRKKKVKK